MTIKLRTKHPDATLKRIVDALKPYEAAHPRAKIEVYRQNSVSVRIRVIDEKFKGTSRAEREEELWKALEALPDETVAEISLLLLLTPTEAKESLANYEFDNPVPSKL
jgi:hypothetical protein